MTLSKILVPTAGVLVLVGTAEGATIGPLIFEAATVVVDDFVGTLNVEVVDDPAVTLSITGTEAKIADIAVRLDGSSLVLRRGMGPTGLRYGLDLGAYPVINVRVPSGTPLTIDDMDGMRRTAI